MKRKREEDDNEKLTYAFDELPIHQTRSQRVAFCKISPSIYFEKSQDWENKVNNNFHRRGYWITIAGAPILMDRLWFGFSQSGTWSYMIANPFCLSEYFLLIQQFQTLPEIIHLVKQMFTRCYFVSGKYSDAPSFTKNIDGIVRAVRYVPISPYFGNPFYLK